MSPIYTTTYFHFPFVFLTFTLCAYLACGKNLSFENWAIGGFVLSHWALSSLKERCSKNWQEYCCWLVVFCSVPCKPLCSPSLGDRASGPVFWVVNGGLWVWVWGWTGWGPPSCPFTQKDLARPSTSNATIFVSLCFSHLGKKKKKEKNNHIFEILYYAPWGHRLINHTYRCILLVKYCPPWTTKLSIWDYGT